MTFGIPRTKPSFCLQLQAQQSGNSTKDIMSCACRFLVQAQVGLVNGLHLDLGGDLVKAATRSDCNALVIYNQKRAVASMVMDHESAFMPLLNVIKDKGWTHPVVGRRACMWAEHAWDNMVCIFLENMPEQAPLSQ